MKLYAVNGPVLRGLLWGLAVMASVAQAQVIQSRNGLTVTVPNGYPNVQVTDMVLSSEAGPVKWERRWDGQEWRFNPHWESLSSTWRNLTGSQAADTTSGTPAAGSGSGWGGASSSYSSGSSGGGGDGCWVWVDEDWQPSEATTMIGGVPQGAPLLPARATPFNKVMGDNAADYMPLTRVNVDYATLCPGAASGMAPTIRGLDVITTEVRHQPL